MSPDRTFRDILDGIPVNRRVQDAWPLIAITDEKKEYRHVLFQHPLFRNQDEAHRVAQGRVHGKEADMGEGVPDTSQEGVDYIPRYAFA